MLHYVGNIRPVSLHRFAQIRGGSLRIPHQALSRERHHDVPQQIMHFFAAAHTEKRLGELHSSQGGVINDSEFFEAPIDDSQMLDADIRLTRLNLDCRE